MASVCVGLLTSVCVPTVCVCVSVCWCMWPNGMCVYVLNGVYVCVNVLAQPHVCALARLYVFVCAQWCVCVCVCVCYVCCPMIAP